jgi:hypothetical protein
MTLVFLVSCKSLTNTRVAKSEPTPSFRNQGEQEDYWAKQFFEKQYEKSEYSKFIGEVRINNSEILFGETECVKYSNPKSEYQLIFEKGLLYPAIMGVDTMNICCLEELTFLSDNPEIKRFRFWQWEKIGNVSLANPSVYLFELTNETAKKETDWETFMENAKLTFIKYGWTVI